MSDGIYTALSGALAQEKALAVVANNVANTGTAGFQADKVVFGEMMAKSQAGTRPQSLHYVGIDSTSRDVQAGGLQQTGNSLDVALQGDGYFAVRTSAGERYTRAGSFVTDSEGVLRTHSGLPVLGEAGKPSAPGTELTLPTNAKEVRIAPDGKIDADGQTIGKLKIVRFEGVDALAKEGITLLAPNAGATPVAAEDTTVTQGFLESANVNAVAGMNELITVSRSFEAFQKVIETFRQLDERTARDVGGRV
jgi:flagellar basal-body rod protein FlgF